MAVVSLSERSGATAAVGTRKLSAAVWIVQGLLAVVFLFTGIMKLTAPSEMLAAQVPMPELFVRFLGLVETLGALGLILPGAFRIRTGLTPLAACGLVIIMIGATVLTPNRSEFREVAQFSDRIHSRPKVLQALKAEGLTK